MFDFLRSNILNKISTKDLPMVCFVVTQHSESALSLCLRYSKTSSLQATPKNIRIRSDDHTKRRGGIHIQPLQPFHKNPYLFYFCGCKYTNKTDTLQIFPQFFLVKQNPIPCFLRCKYTKNTDTFQFFPCFLVLMVGNSQAWMLQESEGKGRMGCKNRTVSKQIDFGRISMF